MARRGKFGRAALLLGAAAVAAGVLLKRDKVTGLLSSGASQPQDTGWAPAPATGPSNYDAPGPVANTATPVPAPEPQIVSESGSIDEAAEEDAAAAEAANIGGTVSDYAGPEELGDVADEAERPLMEAGEGSAEGLEQAEAELEAAAEEPLVGASDFGGSIDDAIEDAGRPFSGERLEASSEPLDTAPEPDADAIASEPVAPEPLAAEPAAPTPEPAPEPAVTEPPPEPEAEPAAIEPETAAVEPELAPEPPAQEPAPEPAPAEAEPGGQIPFGEGTMDEPPAETPGVPQTEELAPSEEAPEPEPATEPQVTPAAPQTGWQPPAPPEPPTEEQKRPNDDDEDDGDDWRTWSGQAIRP